MKNPYNPPPPPINSHPYAVEVVGSAPGSQWVELHYCRIERDGHTLIAQEQTGDAAQECLTKWRYRVVQRRKVLDTGRRP